MATAAADSKKSKTVPTPGDVLLKDYVEPYGLNLHRLAREIDVPYSRIRAICYDGRAITVDTAVRLSRFFGKSEEFWIAMQYRYELRVQRPQFESAVAEITPFEWPELDEEDDD